MIKTLTPYYISIPLLNPSTGIAAEKYTVDIYAWQGSKTATPATPEYSITKINASGSAATDKINVSRILNDYIDFNLFAVSDTSLEDGNNQAWTLIQIKYDSETIPQIIESHLVIKGYGYFLEGQNPQPPSNKILLTGDEFKVNRSGRFILPILADEAPQPVPPEEFFIESIDPDAVTITFVCLFTHTFVTAQSRSSSLQPWVNLDLFGQAADVITLASPLTDGYEIRLGAFNYDTNEWVYTDPVTFSV